MNTVWSVTCALWSALQHPLHRLVRPPALPAVAVAPTRLPARQCNAGGRGRPATRPLRVVRVMEAGQSRTQVGRMVISGRMADVCAELDRLAACEAARP
jgi:hypothetical protein